MEQALLSKDLTSYTKLGDTADLVAVKVVEEGSYVKLGDSPVEPKRTSTDKKEKSEDKPKKEKKDKKEKDEVDVVMPVSFTILAKSIEDDDGKLFLVGTMIYRVVNPFPTFGTEAFPAFQMRINDQSTNEEMMEIRRGRPVEFENAPEPNMKGVCITSQIKLPLRIEQEDSISYPYKIIRAKVKIEFSSPAIDGVQYRPSIMEFNGPENTREFLCLKHHKKANSKPTDAPEDSYDQEAFDQSAAYDTIHPIPEWVIEPERKGKIQYFPKVEFEWALTSPFLKPLVSTLVPVLLLLGLQWINWINTLVNDDPDPSGYFTNAITLILALVVLVPSIQQSTSSLRSTMGTVEYMIFFFFLGTGLSAVPQAWVSFAGLIVTSLSMIFPISGTGKYISLIKKITDNKPPVQYCLPVPGSKARGELVDFHRVSARPTENPLNKEEQENEKKKEKKDKDEEKKE